MNQTDLGLNLSTKRTRKRKLLAEMERVLPWVVEVVRTTLRRTARVWRDDGRPRWTTAPLIEMLDEAAQEREPYPITSSKPAIASIARGLPCE